MPVLIFITGKQGAGKSTVAQNWATSRHAQCVDMDKVLLAGGLEIGLPADRKATDWKVWKSLTAEEQRPCVLAGLAAKYASLRNYVGNLIVEGSILCIPSADAATEGALADWMPAKRDVHRFCLDVSPKRIFENVHERAKSDHHRSHELQKFPDVKTVAKFHEGFDTELANNPLQCQRCSSSEELRNVLNELGGLA